MKKLLFLALPLALCLLTLSACKSGTESVELHVFAAASLTETMDQIIEDYKAVAPEVVIIPTYDSSGTLLTQIKEGADCDLFLSAAPRQMNELEEGGGLLEGTRVDLLENQVVLCASGFSSNKVDSFDTLAEKLKNGEVLLAMGNSDVPVGQYTQKIFAYYGLDEQALAAAGRITYGSNVKEVAAQIKEGSVDCGVVYGTDAHSAGLTVADTATAGMCGQVIYPAAVLKNSAHAVEAQAFLDYLQTDAAGAVFEGVGFSPIR